MFRDLPLCTQIGRIGPPTASKRLGLPIDAPSKADVSWSARPEATIRSAMPLFADD